MIEKMKKNYRKMIEELPGGIKDRPLQSITAITVVVQRLTHFTEFLEVLKKKSNWY